MLLGVARDLGELVHHTQTHCSWPSSSEKNWRGAGREVAGCGVWACVRVRVRHLDASHAVVFVNREEGVVARKHRATVGGHTSDWVAGWQGMLRRTHRSSSSACSAESAIAARALAMSTLSVLTASRAALVSKAHGPADRLAALAAVGANLVAMPILSASLPSWTSTAPKNGMRMQMVAGMAMAVVAHESYWNPESNCPTSGSTTPATANAATAATTGASIFSWAVGLTVRVGTGGLMQRPVGAMKLETAASAKGNAAISEFVRLRRSDTLPFRAFHPFSPGEIQRSV